MVKKLMVLGFVAVMILGIFGLSACDNVSLDDYKVTGKTAIDAHISTKTQSDYSKDKWAEVLCEASDGKQAIEDATSKMQVDLEVEGTKKAIDEVQKMDLEEKIIWNGTIDDIVDNETILITIDKNFNSKQFTSDDFKMVEIVEDSFSWLTKSSHDNYIETESLPENFRHIIIIKIIDKGKQNLIDAIRILEAVNFVNSASPNSYDSPD